jgi:Fe-S-cluster containining protein
MRPEIERIAKYLKIPIGELRRKYLTRIGFRTTIVEQDNTKDCIFLKKIDGDKKCIIYPVRPSQCRNWPFWPDNLKGPSAWNQAIQKCPGINRGRLCTFEEIQKIKKNKHWWDDEK